jgi:hypothetical protein
MRNRLLAGVGLALAMTSTVGAQGAPRTGEGTRVQAANDVPRIDTVGTYRGRLALTDAYIALGDAVQHAGDTVAARRAWAGALAVSDSITRATGVAELRVLNVAALMSLGRVEEARPIVQILEQQGYRRPRWLTRMRVLGLLSQQ